MSRKIWILPPTSQIPRRRTQGQTHFTLNSPVLFYSDCHRWSHLMVIFWGCICLKLHDKWRINTLNRDLPEFACTYTMKPVRKPAEIFTDETLLLVFPHTHIHTHRFVRMYFQQMEAAADSRSLVIVWGNRLYATGRIGKTIMPHSVCVCVCE